MKSTITPLLFMVLTLAFNSTAYSNETVLYDLKLSPNESISYAYNIQIINPEIHKIVAETISIIDWSPSFYYSNDDFIVLLVSPNSGETYLDGYLASKTFLVFDKKKETFSRYPTSAYSIFNFQVFDNILVAGVHEDETGGIGYVVLFDLEVGEQRIISRIKESDGSLSSIQCWAPYSALDDKGELVIQAGRWDGLYHIDGDYLVKKSDGSIEQFSNPELPMKQ